MSHKKHNAAQPQTKMERGLKSASPLETEARMTGHGATLRAIGEAE